MNIHYTIKFWGRKDPTIFEQIINGGKKIVDPFCGAGTSGYVSGLKGCSALLSDINPVSIFISGNLLNKTYLDEKTVKNLERELNEIQKRCYSVDSGILQEAVYMTYYRCPNCGELVSPMNRENGKLVCNCSKRFAQREAREAVDRVREVVLQDWNGGLRKTNPKEYTEDILINSWYPKRKFEYERNKAFKNLPNFGKRVDQIFFPRGLKAAAETYELIESIDDEKTKDFLKLIFIASLYSATKMIPYSATSGPSWKIPRYWTPPVKVERNFIQTFIRRLRYLNKMKKAWSELVKDYEIFVDYFGNVETGNDKYLSIVRSDARDFEPPEVYDVAVMDPPHYGEILYFEMTYLWQCWLYGKKRDKRFRDFRFWKKEIDVNLKLRRDLSYYNEELAKVVGKYMDYSKKIFLILHNSIGYQFKTTLKLLKEKWDVEVKTVELKVPTSAQGIHGRKKRHLYLLEIKN
ncbi:hypothetical protein [Archaeoglobus sp.]